MIVNRHAISVGICGFVALLFVGCTQSEPATPPLPPATKTQDAPPAPQKAAPGVSGSAGEKDPSESFVKP